MDKNRVKRSFLFICDFMRGTVSFVSFSFCKEKRKIPPNVDDVLLSAILSQDSINCEQALNIPAVARCVNLISETVSMIPIKLYREDVMDGKRKTVEVTDSRCDLLNEDTKDTLDGAQFKKALVRDYLLSGNAYAYISAEPAPAMSR